MLTLHKQGETVQAMSRQLGRSVSLIYRLFKTLNIRLNSTKTRQRRRFTADELSILSSWMDREVYSQEIADNFPDRTTGSIGRRLYVERQKVGSTIRPRRMWSPADDAQLLALVAAQSSILNTSQICRDVAPTIGRSVATTLSRLHDLRKS